MDHLLHLFELIICFGVIELSYLIRSSRQSDRSFDHVTIAYDKADRSYFQIGIHIEYIAVSDEIIGEIFFRGCPDYLVSGAEDFDVADLEISVLQKIHIYIDVCQSEIVDSGRDGAWDGGNDLVLDPVRVYVLHHLIFDLESVEE